MDILRGVAARCSSLSAVVAVVGPPAGAIPADLADSVVAVEVLAAVAAVPVGNEMRTKEFLGKLEHDRIVQAIRNAESKTSGRIRVYIQRGKFDGDPFLAAQRRFHRLGMHKTPERNGVLIWVAPRAHKFAVVGDKAIHDKCGEELWQRLIDQMRDHFKNEKFNHALVEAIEETGRALAEHFPNGSTSSTA